MKERSSSHGNEHPSRHGKHRERKNFGCRSSRDHDSSHREGRSLRSTRPTSSSRMPPVDQTVTTTSSRRAKTTREPWQPPVSPKAERSKARRKQARLADTAATMDAALDTPDNNIIGRPSRTMFPSRITAEMATSSLSGGTNNSSMRQGESTDGTTMGDSRHVDYRLRGDGRVDQSLEESRALELQDVEKLIKTDGSTSTRTRDICSLMIHKASVKLPRDVHRAILDMYQVTILEPHYYPPDAELEVSACVSRCVRG